MPAVRLIWHQEVKTLMRTATFRVVLGYLLLHITQPALAAPPDKCATTLEEATVGLAKVVRDIDKRTAREASKAGTAGATVYSVARELLEALAKQSRATGGEDDLNAARHIDDAVTQLKVIVPTVHAIGAWGEANKTCDEVKLLTHADPNTVCEAASGQSGEVTAACRNCDAATAKMLQVARGTPAGEHTIEELIETTVEDIGLLIDGLDDPQFTRSTLAARQKAALTEPLATVRAALQATLESSRAGEAAWEVYDDLRGGTFSPEVVEKLDRLPRWTEAPQHAKGLRSACKPPEPAAGCEEGCQERGKCVAEMVGDSTSCKATTDAQCASSELCRDTGRCKAVKGSCRKAARSPDECRAWSGCQTDGECSLNNGICVVGGADDCTNSTGCLERGTCGFYAPGVTGDPYLSPARGKALLALIDPLDLLCRPLSNADCRRSTGCTEEAKCSLQYGYCYLTNDADCQVSNLCREKGGCSYSERLWCCFDPRFPFGCVR